MLTWQGDQFYRCSVCSVALPAGSRTDVERCPLVVQVDVGASAQILLWFVVYLIYAICCAGWEAKFVACVIISYPLHWTRP